MILDDHEIENNWTQDRLQQPGKHELFNLAIGAYMSYQWSHGPRDFGRLLYYTFTCGGYPFFVLDARTQRYKDDEIGLADNHMLGRPTIDPRHPSQLRRLKAWLTAQQERIGDAPKFVVSSSVFVPNEIRERLDPALPDENRRRREASGAWPAYPETRRGCWSTSWRGASRTSCS
jgi:alkaline phosphatase D